MHPGLSRFVLLEELLVLVLLGAGVFAANIFISPPVCSGQWTNCKYAFTNDARAASVGVGKSGIWNNYSIPVPASAQITNVMVTADFWASNMRGYANIQVSADGGVTYGPAHTIGGNTAERRFFIDVTTDMVWTPEKFSAANFRVKATCVKQGSGTNPTCRLDWLPVNVTYVPFDFTLAIAEPSKTVPQSLGTTTIARATLISGNSQPIQFSVSGCPPAATCTITPGSGSPTFTSVLNVTTTTSTPSGTYPLTITGSNGIVTKSTIFTLTVTDSQPLVSISATPLDGTIPLQVQFTGQGTGGDGILSYFWDFRDGGMSYEQNPLHVFSRAGIYDTLFRATDNDGDYAEASIVISASQIACEPSWQCSAWSSCTNGTMFRTCSDMNACGISAGKPAEQQPCANATNQTNPCAGVVCSSPPPATCSGNTIVSYGGACSEGACVYTPVTMSCGSLTTTCPDGFVTSCQRTCSAVSNGVACNDCALSCEGHDMPPPSNSTSGLLALSHSPAMPSVNGQVTITATQVSSTTINHVYLYLDGTYVQYCGYTPCTYTTSFSSAGSHLYYAYFYDATGITQIEPTSGYRYFDVGATPVNDTIPPMISVTATPASATLNQNIMITASASDNQALSYVNVFVDGMSVTTCTTSPCSVVRSYPNAATHTYAASAIDSNGNSATTSVQQFTVTAPSNTTSPGNTTNTTNSTAPDTQAPSVSLSIIPPNPTTDQTITITATASDNRGLSSLIVYIDGFVAASCAASPCAATRTYSTSGTHTYSALASDTSNNVASTGTNQFTVSSPAPPPDPNCCTTVDISVYNSVGPQGYGTGINAQTDVERRANPSYDANVRHNMLQTFVSGKTGTLPRFDLYLSRKGVSSGTATIELHEGSLTGPLLYQTTVPLTNIPLWTSQVKTSATTFNPSPAPTVSAGTTYVIVIRANADWTFDGSSYNSLYGFYYGQLFWDLEDDNTSGQSAAEHPGSGWQYSNQDTEFKTFVRTPGCTDPAGAVCPA